MSAEGLAGTIFGMLALDASSERIVRIIARALAEERAVERARCAQLVQIVGTAHTYSEQEHASGFAADNIVRRIALAIENADQPGA